MDEEFLIFIWLIVLVVAILINHYIAKQFYEVAKMKGHYERKYYWIPFVFSVVGYLLVIALPIKKDEPLNSDELPEL